MDAVPVMLRLAGRNVSAFRACGWIGLGAATVVALAVAHVRGLSVATESVLIGVAVATFLALALAMKAVMGRETLIYYHHEIGVLAVVGLVVAALGAPVLGHLDATALGLGAFLCCGRIGCLLVGCCHGRPASAGVTYGERHAAAGFPRYLVDVPLVPVQALEAGVAAALVVAGVAVSRGAPGSALGLYVSGYALARFGLEELRGDTVRRYWRRLSEAQWTSLLVVAGATAAAAAGALPDLPKHLAALVLLSVAAAAAYRRRADDLLGAGHVREIASTLPSPQPGRARVAETSLGLRLSGGRTGPAEHYTLSRATGGLSRAEAERLARVIVSLRHAERSANVVPGAAGAFHVVLDYSDSRR